MSAFTKIALVLSVCVLSGCSSFTVKTQSVDSTKLELELPKPLKLRAIQYKMITHENEQYVGMDMKNWQLHEKNLEDIQNRLWLQNQIIRNQEEFYTQKLDEKKSVK